MIEISSNIKDVTNSVRDIAGQIPFATAKALNQAARDVQAPEITNLQDREWGSFLKPSPPLKPA